MAPRICSPGMSQRRTLHDRYFRQAKDEGYLARSAYKLKEIHQKKSILRRGDKALDLGCAPGAWMQVALEIVGEKGVVVGVDLKPVAHPFPPNAVAVVGDIFEIEPAALLHHTRGALFDVILSDMAPNTSGHDDHFPSVRLCERVLDLAPRLLAPGGDLVMKVFEGETYPDLLKRASAMFAKVKGFKPQASREMSREMYVVCQGFGGKGMKT